MLYLITWLLPCSIMPRVKHSAADAVFCAKFIHRLHTLDTWGFSSVQIYDKVLLWPTTIHHRGAVLLLWLLLSRALAGTLHRGTSLHLSSGVVIHQTLASPQ